jgi:hypothetical protein
MYGLPQAGIIVNQCLNAHLAKAGYYPVTHTSGLYKHLTRPIVSSLVVDDFGVKYLDDTLTSLYSITTDCWEGKLDLGMTPAWNYETRTVNCSKLGTYKRPSLNSSIQHCPAPTLPACMGTSHLWCPYPANCPSQHLRTTPPRRYHPPPKSHRHTALLCPRHRLHRARRPRQYPLLCSGTRHPSHSPMCSAL